MVPLNMYLMNKWVESFECSMNVSYLFVGRRVVLPMITWSNFVTFVSIDTDCTFQEEVQEEVSVLVGSKSDYSDCPVGIYWIALVECYQKSIHVPGFQSFFQNQREVLVLIKKLTFWIAKGFIKPLEPPLSWQLLFKRGFEGRVVNYILRGKHLSPPPHPTPPHPTPSVFTIPSKGAL